MKALLIVLGILFLLAILPLGGAVRYDGGGARAYLVLGPIKLLLYPRKAKESKPKNKKEKKPKIAREKASEPQSKEMESAGGSVKKFTPFVKLGLSFLNELRWKLRVNRLDLKVVLAAEDPADLALTYAKANAALGSFWPLLEQSLRIRKRNVSVQCDFEAEQTLVFANVKITITLGRTLALAVKYGIRALIQFMKLKKQEKAVQST